MSTLRQILDLLASLGAWCFGVEYVECDPEPVASANDLLRVEHG